ncbi:hypothetical protein AVEN_252695-1 [Araneus ventricosus]|uniref:DUF4817 domain-containing protein n=1 Tax=Araneus ventricosus TaxID=182803 RepID=A0A4Y1ZNV4_ARAVE|nr:hypothetical protein AVEN_252695-1 [Araneus ventricosus]
MWVAVVIFIASATQVNSSTAAIFRSKVNWPLRGVDTLKGFQRFGDQNTYLNKPYIVISHNDNFKDHLKKPAGVVSPKLSRIGPSTGEGKNTLSASKACHSLTQAGKIVRTCFVLYNEETEYAI